MTIAYRRCTGLVIILVAVAPQPTWGANWTPAPSLNVPRELFGAAVDECGNIWVVGGWNRNGGCNGGGPLVNNIETLVWGGHSYSNQWEVTAITLPSPRYFHSVVVSRGFLYLLGGLDNTDGKVGEVPMAGVDRYDLVSGTWSDTAVPPTPTPRFDGAAIVDSRGRIWHIGGQDVAEYNLHALASVDIFDPARPELGWQTGPSMHNPRARFGCVIDRKGRIVVTGGFGAGGAHLSSVERIDPCGSSQWVVLAESLPEPASNDDQASMGADGQVYVAGGWVGSWTNRVIRLNSGTDTVQLWQSMIEARSQHRLVLGRDDFVYAIGGDVSGCVSTTSVEMLYTGRPAGDVNGDNEFNGDDIQPIVNALLAS